MESKESNGVNNNFENFMKLQKKIMESFSIGANVGLAPLPLDDLFNFLDEHFNELHQKENLRILLAFIHRCLEVWVNRGDYSKDDIGEYLINFMDDYIEDEDDLAIVIQIVYQVMNTINYFEINDVLISEELLQQLISIVLSVKNRTLLSCCIACIQLYMKMFPGSDKIFTTLWLNLKSQLATNLKIGIMQDTEIDILIQLIDNFKSINYNFYEEPILVATIQHLLNSDQRKYRKCGYYLSKKVWQYFMNNFNTTSKMWISSDHNQLVERSWIMYITILENLEEEQSHLILPSLENLEELIKSKHLESSWLDILYMRILTHNNNLVLRWSIEFFLKTFSCSDLCANTFKHLLQASNSNFLYNYEGYFLDEDHISSFLSGNITNLLTLLPEIVNWKPVPLYMWLEKIDKTRLPKSLTYEVILKISACVRKMQNCSIRKNAIITCNTLFKDFIEKMSLEEYVTYVETLHNSGDIYKDHKKLFDKKFSLIESKSKCSIFKQRFYEIFTNRKWDNNKLISFLNGMTIEQQGWLKFALFKLELSECHRKYIYDLYKLDLNSLANYNLHKIMNIFQNCFFELPPSDKHELRECQSVAISFYIYQKSNFVNEDEDTLRFILNFGLDKLVLNTFAKILLDNAKEKINLCFIDELLKYNSKNVHDYISNYLCRFYDESLIHKYAVLIFEKYKYIPFPFYKINLLENCKDKLLKDLASKGESRIEQAFCFNYLGDEMYLRSFWFEQIYKHGSEKFILDLLKYHDDLTKKKPRYFENSNEHRIKLRIAICVFTYILWKDTTTFNVLNRIWNILLNENNQLNVIYIYETILGKYESREDVILKKMKESHCLTSSQQMSIISVSNIWLQCKTLKQETKVIMASNFLALTMGSNFQTRLLAQISLYLLLKDDYICIEGRKQIIQSIEYAAGTKLPEYLNEIRVQILKLSKKLNPIEIILYVTNAPFDEYFKHSSDLEDYNEKQLDYCRETFMKKFKLSTNEKAIATSTINDQIQRKMNPVDDLTEPHNLMVYPNKEKLAEMFVIASLIDKLPNLGGIARTCEVLGIKNLVMDSKMHTEKSDFKNLSMTAEKNLNIVEVKPNDLKEFLINKKLEGFSIIGAEQTSNSQNFSNFKFPQKCVLLLGHEKDGIPAPLLGLLDYAVEIPQFGQVRSLNVHVTGALFMWEYCKQHLV